MDNQNEVRGDTSKDHDLTVLKEDGRGTKQGSLVFGEEYDTQVDDQEGGRHEQLWPPEY